MKKYLFIVFAGFLLITTAVYLGFSQDNSLVNGDDTEITVVPDEDDMESDQNITAHQQIKRYFIEGGFRFMGIVLICLIIGLALAIERIIMLSLSDINSDDFINEVDEAMGSGGIEAAKEVCRSRRGPIASIYYQGLERVSEGIEMVEKAIISYGSVQMGHLERGLVWISLFISLAPMLGFMGTVIGMIGAFENIELADDISPSIVAGGIKVALLTTLAGLTVAVILQVFYNYIVSKIDSIVNKMEDASISLIDMLIKNKGVSK